MKGFRITLFPPEFEINFVKVEIPVVKSISNLMYEPA